MPDSTPGFDLTTFDTYWASLDSAARTELLKKAGSFPPSFGILPILEGLFSYHFGDRTAAKKSLGALALSLQKKMYESIDSASRKEGRADAVRVCARIYQQLSSELPFADKSVLVSTLMTLGGTGAFFAFKALYQDRLSLDVMKKCIQNMDEYQRLIFVSQYLQANPGIRLRFAALFKSILTNIKERETVILFYARLFDRKQDADPFLKNIDPALRNPEMIADKEVRSTSPDKKIKGLKALSMMRDRIPVQILKNALSGEEVKKVRMAVYSLIENSSMGLYPELFEPVFERFKTAETNEAVKAFKALVVTGKLPLHRLMDLARSTYPSIIPIIHMEVSDLSRLSFFAIQDIALNKDHYKGDNYDVNLACIFGMIKKRPERVVRILKTNRDLNGSGKLKNEIDRFMKKTTQLLQKERDSIESDFNNIQVHQKKPETTRSFFKTVLKDPTQKKLELLKEEGLVSDPDFQDMSFIKEDLSGMDLSGSNLKLTRAVFSDTYLSSIKLSRAICRKTLFYNVNMDGAVFDQVCFDNAVFINVSAKKAQFIRCSFHGASFFNCNLNQADLTDALFIDATISKTSFGNTNLTCASFAHAKIAGVSFSTACLNLGDFSGVKARFCRFPSYAREEIRTRQINYNAREHQLSFNDLPRIGQQMANEINMLIYCEFIHYGEAKFLNQNKLSLLTAFDIFKSDQADFFILLPLLLHENISLPEMKSIPETTPCGIADYLPSRETAKIAERYIGRKNVVIRRNFAPYIEGVYSMGSVGSLAQTAESDIDYWICVDERILDNEGMTLLKQKLDAIEILALERFKIHVTFFIVDVLKARNNDFGGSTQESSGSAQSRLLKEEFYRTMIHVAGKLPLWAALPTSISINYYNLILERISKLSKTNRYIDLGDIHAIPVNEFFGASIWQMFKWLKSPFKSVIKMALLEKYINAYGQETLLCNQYKNEWMNSGSHLKPGQNDSYIILLNTLIDFYLKAGDQRSINLLLTCFFLKLGISKESEVDFTVFGLRKILLTRSLNDWGWTFKKIYEIGRFRIWPYAAIHRLSLTIERYMVTKYTDLKKRFETRSVSGLMISEQDRIVLERKVNIVFQDKPNKIKKLLLVSRGDRHFSRLHIRYIPLPGKSYGQWELIHKIPKHRQQNEESIITADSIEEIGAWLINNSLYTERTFLGMVPNPTVVSHDDIEKLYRSMYEFFEPSLKKTVHFSAMRKQPEICRLFISLNFYTEKSMGKIYDYTVIYLNSWGEMYLRNAKPSKPLQGLEAAKREICIGLSLDDLPKDTAFYFSKGVSRG
ncbi:MAG: class I adenylate cyclase [Desulfobacterales bacterium]|nr:class I adenylate cyclase [Desulfobacterales bacterium]